VRLHRLRLDNFRGVEHRELHLPDAGVVVLEGANEIGKTSMVDALDMLLTEKHSSRKASVLAVKPVHRDEPSAVEAEMSSGPYRFTYRKQWHQRPGTTLTVTAPRPEQVTGEPAHARVQQILAETLDEGLWKALRLLQGTPLDTTALSGSSALTAALDAAAGTASASDDSETLLGAVAARAAEFLTGGGKPTGRYRAALEELERARAAREQAGRALAEVAGDVERHADLLAARERLLEHRRGTDRAAQEHRAAVDALTDRRSAVERTAAQAEAAARAAAEALELASARAEQRADADERRRRAGELAEALAGERAARDAAQEHAEALGTAGTAARDAADAAREAAARAREDARLLGDVAARDALARRLAELADATTQVLAAERRLAVLRVDAPALRAVEAADDAARLARARAEAAAPRVLVDAVATEVGVGGDVVPAGSSVERTATERLEVDVAGFARVTVLPGADAQTLAADLRRAERARDDALADAGVGDVEAARTAHEDRRDAEAALALARQRRAQLAGDGDAGALGAEHARLDAQVQEALTARAGAGAPGDADGPTDAAAAERREATARAAEDAARAELARAEAAASEARRRLDARRTEVAGREAALAAAQEEARRADERLAAARARVPDEEVAAAATAAEQALTGARAAADAAAAELAAADGGSAAALLAHAEAVLARADADLARTDADLAALRVRLDFAGQEGRQDAADAAETALEAATREVAALTRRAEAARLLRDVLERHRSDARRRYVAPFSERLESLGAVVFGDTFRVELDDDLRIVSRTLAGRTVRYENLSTGAREQLAVLTRLACAALVDPDDGVPVVLDDVLGHSDPDRLRRLGAVFGMVAPPAQVLLLTPGPGAHASIPGAVVVRLDHVAG